DDAAGRRVEAPLRMGVADLRDALANELRDVDVDLGGDLAGDDHESRRDQRLAGAARGRVTGQHRVEDAVGDLVGELVRLALGDRLGGEEELSRAHGRGGYLLDPEEERDLQLVRVRGRVLDRRTEGLDVARDLGRDVRLSELFGIGNGRVDVHVE